MPEEQSAFEPGQMLFGKYKIIAKLGTGGMGSVYRVQQMFLDKSFALKTLDIQHASDISLQRFQLEAKAASSLNHPSLIQVHDFGMINDEQPYMVMDFVNGINFAEYLKMNGPISTELVPLLFAPVCFGLLAAHEQGIVHRDIKPSNLMIVDGVPLDSTGSIKIVDFGIAKLTNVEAGDTQALTRTGEIVGSPLYMSPEQCTGAVVDSRSDVYSLGCVLFEMLTGTPPYLGKNALNTMMLHDSGKAPTLKEASLGRDYPEGLEKIVSKMLSREARNRYQNIGEVAHELADACKSSAKNAVRPAAKSRNIATSTSSKSRLSWVIGAVVIAMGMVATFALRHPLDKTAAPGANPLKQTDHATETLVLEKLTDLNGLKSAVNDRIDAKMKTALTNSAPIVSTIEMTKNGKTRKFVFPDCSMGFLCELRAFDFGHIVAKMARGVVYVPADVPLVLDLGGSGKDVGAALDSPSVFAKIGSTELCGLVLSKDQTAIKTERIESILRIAASWSNLTLVSLNKIDKCDKVLEILNQFKNMNRFQLLRSTVEIPESANQPFLARMAVLSFDNIDDAAMQKIMHRLTHSKKLTALTLDNITVSPEELECLFDCPKLGFLQIMSCNDQIIQTLVEMKQLSRVFLKQVKLTPNQAKILNKSKNPTHITLTKKLYSLNERAELIRISPKFNFTDS